MHTDNGQAAAQLARRLPRASALRRIRSEHEFHFEDKLMR